jgi:hypothetical protein
MLGFSSISELAIAQLPSTFAHFSGVSASAVVDTANPEVNADANISASELGSVSATSALGSLSSITGTANVTLTGISATLSLADVLIWGKVVPGVTTTYANVNTSNSPTWTTVTTGASQTWTQEKR